MLHLKTALSLSVLFLGLMVAHSAVAVTLSFDDVGLTHGSIVDTQYAGVEISAINLSSGPDLAVAFDSEFSSSIDADLQRGGGWSGGNIASNEQLDLMLIIQENDIGCMADGICDSPDDERARAAGSLIFAFDVAVSTFGFDLIDVESTVAEGGSITFFDGATSATISMTTFLAGFQLGNNSANRITPFDVADLDGLQQITKVELVFGGSGAIDNVTFMPIPEPSSLLLVGLGLTALGAARRRA